MPTSLLVPAALLAAGLLFTGCRKDDRAAFDGASVPWQSHIRLSVDSACIQAPNVITPNGDGINDVFCVLRNWARSVKTIVMAPNGEVVFSSTEMNSCWTNAHEAGPGRYRVSVQAVTLSGVTLAGQSYLDVMEYGNSNCLVHPHPITPDRLDPRRCDMYYPTNELFCP
jgi:hypothetical protein